MQAVNAVGDEVRGGFMPRVQNENALVIKLLVRQGETVGFPFDQPAQYVVVFIGKIFPPRRHQLL